MQELTEKKSLLSETELKCKNLQAAVSHTQALIKVRDCFLLFFWLTDFQRAEHCVFVELGLSIVTVVYSM